MKNKYQSIISVFCVVMMMGTMFTMFAGSGSADVVEEWVRTYDYAGTLRDWAHDMVLDQYGNVYVKGYSYSGTDYDFATIKYNSDGNEDWIKRYDSPYHLLDSADAITLDSYGDVYVTGGSSYDIGFYDFATVKYDSDSGNPLWNFNGDEAKRYHMGRAQDIVSNIFGNIFLIGSSYEGGMTTFSYDCYGNTLWEQFYQGSRDSNYGVAIDSDKDGNIYVTGHTVEYGQPSTYDYITVAYDNNGIQLWDKQYDSGILLDKATSIDVCNLNKQVYIAGETGVVAYSSIDGTQIWDSNGRFLDIITDPTSGIVYATGDNTIAFNPSDGSQIWTVSGGYKIDIDSSGNIYVAGSESSPGEGYNCVTRAYDPNGLLLWEKIYDGVGERNDSDIPIDIAVDLSGNVYVTGKTDMGTLDNENYDYLTFRYTPISPIVADAG
ncbi:MAG: SBBP repeat-containing protein, partial [Thermoplasmata archaeon]